MKPSTHRCLSFALLTSIGIVPTLAIAQELPTEPAPTSETANTAEAIEAVKANKPAKANEESVFTLGQITVSGKRQDDSTSIGTATVDREDIRDFDRDGVPETLNLVPGVIVPPATGSRNDTDINVRGFNRSRVPILMDGIRLYLPADNRVDFDRLMTPDLSEVQVSKGYVSVLNGPDGMGGAINLVTRKPVKPLEAEVRITGAFGEGGQYDGNTLFAHTGIRKEHFYLQANAMQRDSDGFRLPGDFKPTQYENGGLRDYSDKKDQRISLKAGFTPNATDEYSLNYIYQEGEKNGMHSVEGNQGRAWGWPEWDTTSLYWLSHTKLGDKSYIKTRAYYNTFKNTLVDYTNTTRSVKNWTSYYDDNAKGFSIEAGTDHLPQQTLKASFHYRRDEHVEYDHYHVNQPGTASGPLIPAGTTEPRQKNVEDMYSIAIEDTWHVTPNFDLVAGTSWDKRVGRQAQNWASLTGGATGSPQVLFDYEVANSSVMNFQGAAIYRYSKTGKFHFFASNRTRFPTYFERYSSRWGGGASNPHLKPERALNLEVGIADRLFPRLYGEMALFHSRVTDTIESMPIDVQNPITGQVATLSQFQNLSKATYKGAEFAFAANPLDTLDIGGNVSFILPKVFDADKELVKNTETPRRKAFLYAKWRPIPTLKIIPSIEHVGKRWSNKATASAANPIYITTGNYTLLNFKVEYQIHRNVDISFSARNLLDKNYQLTDGYPQEGRNYLLSLNYQL